MQQDQLRVYFNKFKQYTRRAKQQRFREVAIYRMAQEREQRMMKAVFSAWENVTFSQNRLKAMKAFDHYESKLKEKGFDGIMDYALQTRKFQDKIVLFYYHLILRKYFAQLSNVKAMNEKEDEEKMLQICSKRFFKKLKNNHQTSTQQLKAQKLHSALTIAQKIQNVQRKVEAFDKIKNIQRKKQIQQSLASSRREMNSTYGNFGGSRRKHAVITDVVTLPQFGKDLSVDKSISRMPSRSLVNMAEKQQKKEISAQVSRQRGEEKVENKQKEDDEERRKKLKEKEKRKEVVLALVSKCKLAELKVLEDGLKSSKYYSATKQSLEWLRKGGNDFINT